MKIWIAVRKLRWEIICCALITVIPAVLFSTGTAHAQEKGLTLMVHQTFHCPLSSAECEFVYELKALQGENPMPEGCTMDSHIFAINGNASAEIGPLNYTECDVYRYELSQKIESKKLGYTYDERVYTIEVYVNSQLEINTVILNENGIKAGEIKFENAYKPKETPKTENTPPPGKSDDRPANFPYPKGSSPKTGDSGNLPLAVILLAASGGMLILLAILKAINRDKKSKYLIN